MNKIKKTLSLLFGALTLIVVLMVLVLNILTRYRLNTRYEIAVNPIPIPQGDSARTRGEHLVRAVSSCVSCHGLDLGGRVFIDQPLLARIYAPNLTAGNGGKASLYSSEDWVRTLRHGLDQTGRPLLFMPAQYYRYYSDADIGAIVAYIQALPPVDNISPPRRIYLIGQVLFQMDTFGALPAENIDHHSIPAHPPNEGISLEYGEFLVNVATCKNCHGDNLAGDKVGPDDPLAPNLTPGGELAGWTEEDFFTLMRSGIHPTGRKIDPLMPWQSFRNMTDSELKAIWVFLNSLPALPANDGSD